MFGRGLALRLLLALVVATAGVVVLHRVVTAREAEVRPGAAVQARPAPAALAQLGFPLAPVAGVVLLVDRAESVPNDVAPVLVVLADGALRVRRHAEAPAGPIVENRANRAGIGAAVVVPQDLLAPGRAAARGALLEVLGAWLPERPLPSARLRDLGLGLARAELDRLCAWLP
ncbi:MAG: hypothetical protein JNK15_01700 [Planctomycetes bacterium]|nr:hypothetical protein [Planctomycetota bacterium]